MRRITRRIAPDLADGRTFATGSDPVVAARRDLVLGTAGRNDCRNTGIQAVIFSSLLRCFALNTGALLANRSERVFDAEGEMASKQKRERDKAECKNERQRILLNSPYREAINPPSAKVIDHS